MIFADGTEVPWWVAALSGVGGTALAGLGKWVWDRAGRNRQWQQEDDAKTNKMKDELIARIDKDRVEAREEAHQVRDKANEEIAKLRLEIVSLRVLFTRAVGHIKHLESTLDDHDIKHLTWQDEPSTVEAKRT